MPCNHLALRRELDACLRDDPHRGAVTFESNIADALAKKHLTPEDFSVQQLFEAFVDNGAELIRSWRHNRGGGGYNLAVLESASAVSTAHFSNIMGQILYTRVKEEFAKPVYLFNELVEVVPTEFNGEKIPGIGEVGDRVEVVNEGETYPLAGVNEEWIDTPQTTKRGLIVPVTKEAIVFDRTGLLMQRAQSVAESIAVNREKRVLDCVFGITNTYKRNGVSANTYNASTPFANIASSNALVDWTDVEAAILKFDGLTDPNTGEPIMVVPSAIIVPTALLFTAKRVVSATEIRFGDGASSTTQTIAANPVPNYRVLSSQYVSLRTSSTSTWFIGDPKRAFKYMQNWAPEVVQAPSNSEAEFTQDIVARFKVSERGVPAVFEPRAMVKCTQ